MKSLKLGIKLALSFSLLVFIPVLISGIFFVFHHEGILEKQIQHKLISDISGLKTIYQGQLKGLENLAFRTIQKRKVLQLFQSKKSEELGAYLKNIADQQRVAMIFAVDKNRSKFGLSWNPKKISTLSTLTPIIRTALSGKIVVTTEEVSFHEIMNEGIDLFDGESASLESVLLMTVAVPIKNGTQTEGVLIFKKLVSLEGSLIRNVAKQFSSNFGIFSQQNLILISSSKRNEVRTFRKIPQDVLQQVVSKGKSYSKKIHNDLSYYVIYEPIQNHSGKTVGIFMAYSEIDTVLGSRGPIILVIFAVLFFGLLIAFILKLVLEKGIFSLLKSVSDAHQLVGDGNFEQEVSVSTDDEFGDLAQSFNIMTKRLQKLSDKQETKVNFLEHKIQDKEKQITHILNNISQGYLAIGTDLYVHDTYSQICDAFFPSGVAAIEITDLLFPDVGVQKERKKFRRILKSIFREPFIFHEVEEQLPKELVVKHKTFKIKYQYIPNFTSSSEQGHLMIILTDISKDLELEHYYEENENKRQLLKNIAVNPAMFFEFFQFVYQKLNQWESLDQKTIKQLPIALLLAELESVSGGCMLFSFKEALEKSKKIEDTLQELYKGKRLITVSRIRQVVSDFGEIKTSISEKLGDLNELLLFSLKQQDLPNVSTAQYFLSQQSNLIKWLATRFGKNVEIEIKGKDFKLSIEKLKKLFSLLPVLFKNILQYSKGSLDENSLNSKEQEAIKISIEALIEDELLKIRIVNVSQDSSKTRSLEKGLEPIKEEVNLLGGAFSIHSEEGKGTTFTLEIPEELTRISDIIGTAQITEQQTELEKDNSMRVNSSSVDENRNEEKNELEKESLLSSKDAYLEATQTVKDLHTDETTEVPEEQKHQIFMKKGQEHKPSEEGSYKLFGKKS
ncbi:MAG: HAMP domain-containing protein [bacterium]|jgi:HAMP domain-containing protein